AYSLVAHLPAQWEFTTPASTVAVAADEKTTRDLAFVPLAGVQGMLRRSGGEPAYAQVTLAGGDVSVHAVGPDGGTPFGSYVMRDVPPGAYTLRVQDGFYGTGVVARGVTLLAGPLATEDVTLPPIGNVHVTVTSAGRPVENARLQWRSD